MTPRPASAYQCGFDGDGRQRERARASWKGGSKAICQPGLPSMRGRRSSRAITRRCPPAAEFCHRQRRTVPESAQELKPGRARRLVLDHTPFYADAGGQVGDVGWLYGDDHNTIVAEVEGATYPVQGVRAHRVVAKQRHPRGRQSRRHGQRRSAPLDHAQPYRHAPAARRAARCAGQAREAGRLAGRSRRTCASTSRTSPRRRRRATAGHRRPRQQEVLRNDNVEVIEDVPIDVAVNEYHAMALFGEKYGDRVRLLIKLTAFIESGEHCDACRFGERQELWRY